MVLYFTLLEMVSETLLKDTSEIQPPPLTGHHCSAPFDVPCIDMCTCKTSEIWAPPQMGQFTVVLVVSLL